MINSEGFGQGGCGLYAAIPGANCMFFLLLVSAKTLHGTSEIASQPRRGNKTIASDIEIASQPRRGVRIIEMR